MLSGFILNYQASIESFHNLGDSSIIWPLPYLWKLLQTSVFFPLYYENTQWISLLWLTQQIMTNFIPLNLNDKLHTFKWQKSQIKRPEVWSQVSSRASRPLKSPGKNLSWPLPAYGGSSCPVACSFITHSLPPTPAISTCLLCMILFLFIFWRLT